MAHDDQRFDEEPRPAVKDDEPFMKLRGLLKDVFRSLGGGEAFLKNEREHFYDDETRE